MPSLPTRRRYQSGVATTLTSGIDSTAVTFTIADTTGWPSGSGNPFFVTIDPGNASEERVLCASRTTNTVTVVENGRGADGTTAKSHGAGAVVWPSLSATDADEANAHASATGTTATVNVHGLAQESVVVGTTDSQTLINKTISASNNTITGLVSQTNGTVTTASTASGVVRNIYVSTNDPAGGSDGDVWLKYS